MSPRTGRPKIDNPKGDFVGVRLDKSTIDKLDEAAKVKKTTRSEVVREGIEKVYSDIKKNP